jgi:hypothetical protein
MQSTGLQFQVSEDGTVEVKLSSGIVTLSAAQLARSPVLSSLTDITGTGTIPMSEAAFKCWHVYEATLRRQNVQDVKTVLMVLDLLPFISVGLCCTIRASTFLNLDTLGCSPESMHGCDHTSLQFLMVHQYIHLYSM